MTISDGDDPWHRATLTDTSTGRRTILLDKNDAAADVGLAVKVVLTAPISPFLPKF